MAFLEFRCGSWSLGSAHFEAAGGVVDQRAFGGVGLEGERSERLAADGEAGEIGVALNAGVFECAGAGERELEAARHLVVELTQGLDLLRRPNGLAFGIDLETAGVEVVAARRR